MKCSFPASLCASLLGVVGVAHAQYFPTMVYNPKVELAPGVTWQNLTNSSPAWNIHVIEIDMANRDVELMPVFKLQGNVSGSSNETTSSMAIRSDAVAAINAGYYNTSNRMTNSYTIIDGVFVGGAGTNMAPEGNRSVLGFSAGAQSIAKRTKLSNTAVPEDPADWDKIIDGIAGRGHFVTSGGTLLVQDNEGTTTSHNSTEQPRTAIGFSTSPEYKAYLVTVDGRQAGFSVGMTYTELGQLMADLGVEESISLDGGGSTTAWVRGEGVVNSPSDGSERAVVSAWIVATAQTIDNDDPEFSTTGTWTSVEAAPDQYYLNSLVSEASAAPATATWTPDLALDGQYKVYAWWTSEGSRSTEAAYEVIHGEGSSTVLVDQSTGGGGWNLLGSFYFAGGDDGSVTLINSGSGSVSADAVRFVRSGDAPAPIEDGFVVLDTIYTNDFQMDSSSDFVISEFISGDNPVDFTYDFSTFSQAGGLFPTSIPPAPRSSDGNTRALRMATNVVNGVANGVTATLVNIQPGENIRITFDAWINYNGGQGGGSGSTEFITFGASADPNLVAMSGGNYFTGSNQPFNGFFFGVTGEGGAGQDYRYYDGDGSGGAVGDNANLANFLGTGAVNEPDFVAIFPPGEFETPGVPGKAWVTWEIVVLNGQVRLLVTKPSNERIILCDWFTPNPGTPITDLLPHFGTMDVFPSLANPASDNFVLIDNIEVQSISSPPQPTSAHSNWMIYR